MNRSFHKGDQIKFYAHRMVQVAQELHCLLEIQVDHFHLYLLEVLEVQVVQGDLADLFLLGFHLVLGYHLFLVFQVDLVHPVLP